MAISSDTIATPSARALPGGGVEHTLARTDVKSVQRRRLSASDRAVTMGLRGGIIGNQVTDEIWEVAELPRASTPAG